MNSKKIITRKYAKAFLNTYEENISQEDFSALKKLSDFFDTHRKVLFYLSVPNISAETKQTLLHETITRFDLHDTIKPLVILLLKHNRIFLIGEILKQIVLFYKRRKNIMVFTITSSHQLSDLQIKEIESFLAKQTGKEIISNYTIDKNLIAGIRVQSKTFLWEYSVAKQCKQLCQQLNIQKVCYESQKY